MENQDVKAEMQTYIWTGKVPPAAHTNKLEMLKKKLEDLKKKDSLLSMETLKGEFHDQGYARWIVIRRSLRGHNDTPCGQPASCSPRAANKPACSQPIGRLQVIIGVFWYY
jgi:hypothetical protein